jgi:pyridoxal phosphate enzyme (YggS family)
MFSDAARPEMHLIGSLQTNKVKYIAGKCALIHSLDSLRLAAEIEKQCQKIDRCMDVLVEVNSGHELSKGGVMPEDVADFCLALSDFPHLNLRGFMTMAPKCDNFEQYRKFFRQTYVNCLDIWQKKLDNIRERPIFSMGMSDSFEYAIAEGATIVRVGGALFR